MLTCTTSVLQGRTHEHREAGPDACEAHTHLVEDEPAENQHQEENVEPAISAVPDSEIRAAPVHMLLQEGLEGGDHIIDVIPGEHGEGHHGEGPPASRFGIAKGLFYCFSHSRIYLLQADEDNKNRFPAFK